MKTLLAIIIGFSLALPGFGDPATAATPAELLFTRTFNLEAAFMSQLKLLAPPKAGESDSELLVRYLKQQHIEIKQPGAIFWNDTKGTLLIRAPLRDVDRISTAIENIRKPNRGDAS